VCRVVSEQTNAKKVNVCMFAKAEAKCLFV
jgi:hypothetical protein